MILGLLIQRPRTNGGSPLVLETVARLTAKGMDVRVEAGARESVFSEDDYRRAGAKIEAASQALLAAIAEITDAS